MYSARKIKFSDTQKSVLLKANSGEHCAPCNFVLLMTLGGTHVHLIVYLVPRCASNEIDYGKINVETNSCTTVPTRTTSLTWTSGVCTVNFEKIPYLFLAF